MLYRNGENLKSELRGYLTDKAKVTIFCPYIKMGMLQQLLDTPGLKCDQIVVRWEPQDLASGASDIEIYETCKDRGVSLFMNHRIHLKLFTSNFSDAFSGSANISARAISEDTPNYNYEICAYTDTISRADRIYLESIIQESILVTDELYLEIQKQLIDQRGQDIEAFDLPYISKEKDDFLISRLPMTDSPELLWNIHSGKKKPGSQQEENCFCHDVVLYKLNELENDKQAWLNTLRSNFFGSPFISEFLTQVDSSNEVRDGRVREGLRFGAVRKWFADNTTTVPSPRPFELTENVQILYRWIENLSQGNYEVYVPGSHSQVIKRRT